MIDAIEPAFYCCSNFILELWMPATSIGLSGALNRVNREIWWEYFHDTAMLACRFSPTIMSPRDSDYFAIYSWPASAFLNPNDNALNEILMTPERVENRFFLFSLSLCLRHQMERNTVERVAAPCRLLVRSAWFAFGVLSSCHRKLDQILLKRRIDFLFRVKNLPKASKNLISCRSWWSESAAFCRWT